MRALSLKNPWGEMIAKKGKRIENRTWPVPGTILMPTWIALHSSKSHSRRDAIELYKDGKTSGITHPYHAGHIFAVARLMSCNHIDDDILKIGAALTHQEYWTHGPWCWYFSEVVELPMPIEVKGGLSLWRVPASVGSEITEQIAELGLNIFNFAE